MPKRPPEYIEGDEAVQRFEGLMKRMMVPKQAGQTVKEAAPAYGKKRRKRKKSG